MELILNISLFVFTLIISVISFFIKTDYKAVKFILIVFIVIIALLGIIKEKNDYDDKLATEALNKKYLKEIRELNGAIKRVKSQNDDIHLALKKSNLLYDTAKKEIINEAIMMNISNNNSSGIQYNNNVGKVQHIK